MQVGWSRGQRVRGNLIYITLQRGNVYLEYDGMEQGITESLIEQGIPAEVIVDASLAKSPVAVTS
jgi:XisI protein